MDNDIWERQALGLIKAFLGIRDARKRQRILDLAEQLADSATSDMIEPGMPGTSTAGERGDFPGRSASSSFVTEEVQYNRYCQPPSGDLASRADDRDEIAETAPKSLSD